MEIYRGNLKESTDYVMTFEELSALFDASEIQLNNCNEIEMNNASFYGRIFARSGGVSEAVRHVIDENKINVEFKPVKCDGAEECDKALLMAKVGKLNGNFIEGLYVHKDYKRQGIGSKLLRIMESQAMMNDYDVIKSDINKTAVPFFDNRYFEVIKKHKKNYKGVIFENYLVEKDL